jgi:hypothetical protein
VVGIALGALDGLVASNEQNTSKGYTPPPATTPEPEVKKSMHKASAEK